MDGKGGKNGMAAGVRYDRYGPKTATQTSSSKKTNDLGKKSRSLLTLNSSTNSPKRKIASSTNDLSSVGSKVKSLTKTLTGCVLSESDETSSGSPTSSRPTTPQKSRLPRRITASTSNLLAIKGNTLSPMGGRTRTAVDLRPERSSAKSTLVSKSKTMTNMPRHSTKSELTQSKKPLLNCDSKDKTKNRS